jgi:transcriptional regulator with AAA-type ATPase domain
MTASAKKIEKKAELISINEISKRLRLDRATVTSRLDDLGYEPDPSSNVKLKLYLFDEDMVHALKFAKDSASATRIRGLRADAQLKELKLAKEQGSLVDMASAIEDLHQVITWIYQEFTLRQPKRIGPKLAKAKSPIEIKKILNTDTERIMKNLRDNFEEIIG